MTEQKEEKNLDGRTNSTQIVPSRCLPNYLEDLLMTEILYHLLLC